MKTQTVILVGLFAVAVAYFLNRSNPASNQVTDVSTSVNGWVRQLDAVENSLSNPQLVSPL